MGDSAGTGPPAARRLVLLRHAKSSWEHDQPDVDRPLTARGRRDAAAAGHWLAAHVGRPDLVLCSTAVRTRQTWAGACQAEPDVLGTAALRLEAGIYQAWPDTLLELVRRVPDARATVVVVGHGPGVPELAEQLSRFCGNAPVGDFPTAAVAVLAVEGRWADLGPANARLLAYAVPRG